MVNVLVYHAYTTSSDPNGLPEHATYGRAIGTNFTFLLSELRSNHSSFADADGTIDYNQLPNQGFATNISYYAPGALRTDRLGISYGNEFTHQLVDDTGVEIYSPQRFNPLGQYQTFLGYSERVDFYYAGPEALMATDGVGAPHLILNEPIDRTTALNSQLWAFEEWDGPSEYADNDVYLVNPDLTYTKVYDHNETTNDIRFSEVFAISAGTYLVGSVGSHDEFYRYDPTTGSLSDMNVADHGFVFAGASANKFFFWDDQLVLGSFSGAELFVSDGTSAGTGLLRNINPDGSAYPGDHFAEETAAIGDTLFFWANDGSDDGNELWVTDGTTAGTVKITGTGTALGPIAPYQFGSEFTVLNSSQVLFNADSGSGVELHISDGTPGGTRMVADLNPGTESSYAEVYDVHGGMAYFSPTGGSRLGDVWVTDGTTSGTQPLMDLRGEDVTFRPQMAEVLNLNPNNLPLWQRAGTGQDDEMQGSMFRDLLIGRRGDDELFGRGADDDLRGGSGADVIKGNGGADRILGGGGADRAIGGGGSDEINGGRGDDILRGGPGADMFVFAGKWGSDRILDLREVDLVDLSRVNAIEDFDDLMDNHLDTSGRHPVVSVSASKQVTLVGVNASSLDEGDFLFASA